MKKVTDHIVSAIQNPDGSGFMYAYLLLRTVIWTLVIYLTQPSLTLDMLEMLALGQEWQWVYDRHPGLPAWSSEFVNIVSGGSALALSALAPIFIAVAIYAVWRLALEMLADKTKAYIAALSLEGIVSFNYLAVEFNHNIAVLTTSAVLGLTAYRAFFKNSGWLWLGIAVGLSLQAKYSSLLLITGLFLWSLWHGAARRQYRHYGPYLSAAVALFMVLPSIPALLENQFAPLEFALNRTRAADMWWHYLFAPLKFILAQLLHVLLALVLLVIVFLANRSFRHDDKLPRDHYTFLWVIAFFPLLAAALISLLGGFGLRSAWGVSLLSFIPLFCVAVMPVKVGKLTGWCRGWLSVVALSLVAVVVVFSVSPYMTGRGKRVHYPGQAIAAIIDEQWQRQYPNAELSYVISTPRYLATAVSYYSRSRPSFVPGGKDLAIIPWASENNIAQKGAVLIWQVGRGGQPTGYLERYEAAVQPEFSVNWLTGADIPSVTLQWAIIPPAGDEK